MSRRTRIRTRLLASHLVVVLVSSATVFVTAGLVAPGAFDNAIGHAMAGMAGMGEMMNDLVRTAFQQATQQALLIATVVAGVTAVVVSVALSGRISRPIGRLAAASRRIASGHYAERVARESDDELGELAESFNSMAGSLETTERRRLDLVGDVAHELRTPLTTLDGYLEGLQDGVVDPSEATWSLLRIETARLARLVDDLQELWRAEARQLPLQVAAVALPDVVAAAVDRFAAPAGAHRIAIRQADLGRLPRVRADAERLGQILDNFLSNAIRYSPPDTAVTVSGDAPEGMVRIRVTDEGPGLTAEQLDHVFERFYRVDRSRSRALGGSGIGLAIARALAEAMGGHVEARSAGPGLGATFSVSLPPA